MSYNNSNRPRLPFVRPARAQGGEALPKQVEDAINGLDKKLKTKALPGITETRLGDKPITTLKGAKGRYDAAALKISQRRDALERLATDLGDTERPTPEEVSEALRQLGDPSSPSGRGEAKQSPAAQKVLDRDRKFQSKESSYCPPGACSKRLTLQAIKCDLKELADEQKVLDASGKEDAADDGALTSADEKWSDFLKTTDAFSTLGDAPNPDARYAKLSGWLQFPQSDRMVYYQELRNRIQEDLGLPSAIGVLLSRDGIFSYVYAKALCQAAPRTADAIWALMTSLKDGLWREIYRYVSKEAVKALAGTLGFAKDEVVNAVADALALEETPFALTDPRWRQRVEKDLRRAKVVDLSGVKLDKLGSLTLSERVQLTDRYSAARKAGLPDPAADQIVAGQLFAMRATTGLDPALAAELGGGGNGIDGIGGVGGELPKVNYYDDDTQAVSFDRATLDAAARMFLTMVWGDEMGVFASAESLANPYGAGARLQINTGSPLASDLSLYLLRNAFLSDTNQRIERLLPTRRPLYYRQVFGVGGQGGDPGNVAFPQLWAVLLDEVDQYLQKISSSAERQNVSQQRVIQAIEDLQYNLSGACNGLAKAAGPLMFAEMDFVIRRLLSSGDMVAAFSRFGSPKFVKVLESMNNVPSLSALYNKGRYGHQMLDTLANHSANEFMDDPDLFAGFLYAVDKYRVAEVQLVSGDDLRNRVPIAGQPGLGLPNVSMPIPPPPVPTPTNGAANTGDSAWNRF